MTSAEELLAHLRRVVEEQAEDEGLWFEALTAPEAYLQQQLRRLHALIEGDALMSALYHASALPGSEEKEGNE